MQDFPLFDVHKTWHEAHRCLHEVIALAERLWQESEYTWLDMLIVRQRAVNARAALGAMPPTLRQAIDQGSCRAGRASPGEIPWSR
jgi:hypothetical protein